MQQVKVRVAVGVTVKEAKREGLSREEVDAALYEAFSARDRLETYMKMARPLIYDGPSQTYADGDLTPVEVLRVITEDTPRMLDSIEGAARLLDRLSARYVPSA